MKALHMVAFLVLVAGGLNWLLLGAVGWEIGDLFGGSDALVSRAIYVVVGLAALYEIATHKGTCKLCAKGGDSSAPQA